ncbi:MutS-related protein [Candidatus Contubernalis alkaliaceticus]|uniref:MutS-related protein n=1 Tax=Candidatus Contubernalis alkaliaceticus TaxID=338645 RepID=UPI001F4C26CB|nr:MutS family DNA mismatch repair protein [Candidatus Contubernalis alkalaceticus]UNC90995.1 MutS family DNA mismatch repair protein [Candidatus Contubernalis alkalaceticus]
MTKYLIVVLVLILMYYLNRKYWNFFLRFQSAGQGMNHSLWQNILIAAAAITVVIGYCFLYLGGNRDPEYFYGLVVLFPLTFLCWWIYRKMFTAKIKEELRSQWGLLQERKRDFKEIQELFRFITFDKEDRHVINQQTWDDLNMDQIYSQVDRTLTTPGEQVLYNMLRTPLLKEEKYKERLTWLNLFQKEQGLRERLLFNLRQFDRQDSSLLCLLLWEEISFESRYLTLYRLMFAAALLSPAFIYFLGLEALLIVVIPIFIINYYLHSMAKRFSMGYVSTMGYLHALIRAARDMGEIKDSRIEELTGPLKTFASACRGITRKAKTLGLESADSVGLYEYVNIFFLIEARGFQNALEEIKVRRKELQKMYLLIGQLDALLSFSSYRTGLTNYVEPLLNKKSEPEICAENIRHPLIPEAVPNSVTLKGMGAIITGSNMSGKSTFLRTLAVNALFAQTICACLADNYQASYFKIMTSISKRDDLTIGKSYYLVEAESLLEMLREVEASVPSFYVIDEILRGTNTVERISAGVEILNYLAKQNCLTVVASHDLEIAKSFESLYNLYHFSEKVGDSGLEFDYRLKEGISKSMNAIKLLEFLGYPHEIVEKAAQRAISPGSKLQ